MRPLGPLSPRISSHPDEDKNVSGKDKDTEVLDLSLSLFAGSVSVFRKLAFSAPKVEPRTCAPYSQLAVHFAQSD